MNGGQRGAGLTLRHYLIAGPRDAPLPALSFDAPRDPFPRTDWLEAVVKGALARRTAPSSVREMVTASLVAEAPSSV